MAILGLRLSRWLGGSCVVAAIVAAVWWTQPEPPAVSAVDRSDANVEEPDLYGTGISFNQLQDDGTLHYRLQAAAIRQFEDQQTTLLDVPHLHLRSAEQPPWDIYSQAGYIKRTTIGDGRLEDTVFLNKAVRMVQKHPVNGTLTLRSESFYLFPDRQYAQTDQNVTIDTEVGRTQAAGMVADLDTGVLTLKSSTTQRVHTIVLPEQFKKT